MADYKDAYENRIFGPSGRGVRALPATLSEGIRPGEDGRKANVVTRTEEELRAYEAAYFLNNYQRFSRYGNWGNHKEGSTFFPSGLNAKVTLVKEIGDNREEDSYGESRYEQGTTGEIGLIFKVEFTDGSGTVIHLQKTGSSDSYGEENWDGELRIVVPKTKVVVEYDYN